MYENFKVYGPYLDKKQNRQIICLVDKTTGKRTSTSYSRYLMEMQLGRELLDSEEVDHIDDDCSNDSLDNLQILSRQENMEKQAKRKYPDGQRMVELVCPWCKSTFQRVYHQTHLSKGGKYPTACTRSCAGKFQRQQESTGRIASVLYTVESVAGAGGFDPHRPD